MRIPSTGLAGLSPRRRKILCEILPEVVPSHYGTAAFREIDGGWKPGAGYTTCGGLPALVARRLGVTAEMRNEGMGGYGLTGLRNGALRRGAWVHASSRPGHGQYMCAPAGTLPQPGDMYLLCSGEGHDFGCCTIQREKESDPWPRFNGATVEHVGIVVDTGCSCLWVTADAGQGGSQMQTAEYVLRNYDSGSGHMTGEQGRDGKPMRRLCGWVDVDRYPFLDGFGA